MIGVNQNHMSMGSNNEFLDKNKINNNEVDLIKKELELQKK